jgi:putative sigma-54 modulation protein
MELTIKGRNGKVTERQRQHIEAKLHKLERYMDDITSAVIEVHTEQQRHAGEVHRVQVTLTGNHGVILRAEEQATDMYAAVDEVQSVLQRQIKRYKEKYWKRDRSRRQSSTAMVKEAVAVNEQTTAIESVPEAEEEVPQPSVIRNKQFRLRPMFVDDAIEQMELLNHSFFVFQDAETSKISVLYRRRDGNYGVIAPDGA